jgi:hypothetical protein
MTPYCELAGFFAGWEVDKLKRDGWSLISAGPPIDNKGNMFSVFRITEHYSCVFPKAPYPRPEVPLEQGGPGGMPCGGHVDDPRMQ